MSYIKSRQIFLKLSLASKKVSEVVRVGQIMIKSNYEKNRFFKII